MTVPVAVSDYLGSISQNDRSFAFLQLDENHCVVASGGNLKSCGCGPLDVKKPIDVQIEALSGILPVTDTPLIINNTHSNDGAFIDIHVFYTKGFQWVLFLDNTKAGAKLQAEQQSRLTDDIARELKESHRN